MKYSVQQIKYELLAYMKAIDPDFRHWLVGISEDPMSTLRDLPGADRTKDPWIFKPAVSAIAARNIRTYFTEQLSCLLPPKAAHCAEGSYVYAIRLTATGETLNSGNDFTPAPQVSTP